MKHLLAALILVATLSGCIMDNPPDPYEFKQGNGGLGTWCRITYIETKSFVDSTTTCGDGSSPQLAKVEWLGTNRACKVDGLKDVLGGISGIRRYFGCVKNQAVGVCNVLMLSASADDAKFLQPESPRLHANLDLQS